MQVFATRKATAVALPKLTMLLTKYRHTVRVMKLTAIILLVVCLQLSARGLSQSITLSLKDVPIQKVFKEIERQTDFTFFADNQWLKKAKKVTIVVNGLPLDQVLELCFRGQPFSYSISGKTITLGPKKEKVATEQKTSMNNTPPIEVKGKVVDSKGTPVANATVNVQGTNKTTFTNANGEFTLVGIDEDAVIIISHVQYETENIVLNGHSIVNATLHIKISSLDEMQVIAYGTTTKRLNTGSVSTVKASDIEKQPINNPLLALQGRVPGMQITQTNGIPGGAIKVEIRGVNSLAYNRLPMYVIDGVPYISANLQNLGSTILGSADAGINAGSGNPLSYLNSADIESIDVLKDADATAIYGSRGANGVVLITTKKGKAGKLKVEVNVQAGIGKVPHFVDLLNSRQYLDMRYEAFKNDGRNWRLPSVLANDLKVWDTTRYTDWQKELIGGDAHYNDAQITLSGGNTNTQYLVGSGYHKETTVFPGDFSNRRNSFLFNLNSVSNDQKFRIQLSTNYSINSNQIPFTDFTNAALNLPPIAPAIYNPDGTFNWANSTWRNPLASYLNRKYNSETNNLLTNAILSYQVIRGLEIKASFGYTNIQTAENTLNLAASNNPSNWALLGNFLRRSSFLNSRFSTWIIEPQLTYNKKISRGVFSILIGSTIQKNKSNVERIDAQGFSSDLVMENPKAAPIISIGESNYALYKYAAVFGRIGYNWQDKYLLNLTARRDGTSRYGPANRFHNFGAAGLGWVFSKEEIIAKRLGFLSFGKIRASYGTTGNEGVGDYSFLDLYNPLNVEVAYQGISSLQLNNLYTPDLQWEETKKLEIGLELGFIKDRIILTVNHYHNTSSNQLVGYTLPSPSGFTTITKNLDAKIENRGWEFSLNTTNMSGRDFKWKSNFNVFWNRNKLVSVAAGMDAVFTKYLGNSLNTEFLYQFAGVNDITGQYQFYDSKGNLTYTPASADQTVLKDRTPKYSGGIQNTLEYKSFQLDFFFHFVKQIGPDYWYNFIPGVLQLEGGNQPVMVLNRWQNPGDYTNVQRFTQSFGLSNSHNTARGSDQRYTDISYIRLKNVSIYWQLPESWKKAVHLQYGRLFASGQNLLTFTKYHGMDPESLSATSLPPLRVITAGIQVTF